VNSLEEAPSIIEHSRDFDLPVGLKERLEQVIESFPVIERIKSDPVFFPRRFLCEKRPRREVEAIGLFSAMLAYGKVQHFMRVIDLILNKCDDRFLDLISDKRPNICWPKYRLNTDNEIEIFARGIGKVINDKGGLWESFKPGWDKDLTIKSGLISLHADLCRVVAGKVEALPASLKHLLPNPASGSCVKRWNMFLRWMIRSDDGIDLGLWKNVSPSKLVIPLDRHISRISRNLGLTERSQDDWRTAQEITDALRKMDPADPVKYDFALCHLGISRVCTHGKNADDCLACGLRKFCRAGKNVRSVEK